MRWVRGCVMVSAAVTVVSGLMMWLAGDELWWLIVGPALLLGLTAVLMRPLVRRAEQHEPPPPEERPARVRRALWITGTTYAVMILIGCVVLTVLEGVVAGLILAVSMAVVLALSLWLSGRLLGERSGSTPE